MSNPPVGLRECRTSSCKRKPHWLCEWDVGPEKGKTMAWCNEDRDGILKHRPGMVKNWRPIKTHEQAKAEFWEEFAK